ncbi:uridine kinase family protein [Curtobacterium oceanosedimentum]|uniref:uridine kinase family protein n=1 Tax=Curtobacterium oceanosedimentum TaxID=465820 RepID=UPI001CE04199|nr:phosphoglycerate transporter [Curtobacterium oceanosedimentum]MCA5922104.1 phosphoglycerate transporter [Curtobacterium oceanosedimentum]
MDRASVIDLVASRRASARAPIVVGVSGYCGSGKSTLTRTLVEALPGAVRIRGDDFLDPLRSHQRSVDWDGVDRPRLVSSVFEPHRAGRASTFQRFDWSARALGPAEPLPRTDVLVVDLIGLFHPDALPHLDVTIWCDVDLQTAAQRGMARDRALGRRHENLWRDVWIPNERDFEERFSPRDGAGVRYEG